MDELESIEGFEWDDGNRDKNWITHRVSLAECEMIFFNQPLIILDDLKHSEAESRYYAFGKTDIDRKLLVVFCKRKNKIRVISARDMNKKEKKFYEEQE
jgi:uncharacterized DUF497 family protein